MIAPLDVDTAKIHEFFYDIVGRFSPVKNIANNMNVIHRSALNRVAKHRYKFEFCFRFNNSLNHPVGIVFGVGIFCRIKEFFYCIYIVRRQHLAHICAGLFRGNITKKMNESQDNHSNPFVGHHLFFLNDLQHPVRVIDEVRQLILLHLCERV